MATYAGWASAQIYADGAVWALCVRADDLGNLPALNYDFKDIWFGEEGKDVRPHIAAKEYPLPAGQCQLHQHANGRFYRHAEWV
ncbi:MAG: hypothetical protein IPK53_07580 [bacterium]|nr:hypothetical protein [bacterium]